MTKPNLRLPANTIPPLKSAYRTLLEVKPNQVISDGEVVKFRLDKTGITNKISLRISGTMTVTSNVATAARAFNPAQLVKEIVTEAVGERMRRHQLSGEQAYILAAIQMGGYAPLADALTTAELTAAGAYSFSIEIPLFFAGNGYDPFQLGALVTDRSDDVYVSITMDNAAAVANTALAFAATYSGTAELVQEITPIMQYDPQGYGAWRINGQKFEGLSAGDFRMELTPYRYHRAVLILTKTGAQNVLSDNVVDRFQVRQSGGITHIDLSSDAQRADMIRKHGLPHAGIRADSPWDGVYYIEWGKDDARANGVLSGALNGSRQGQIAMIATVNTGLTSPTIDLVQNTLEGLYTQAA